MNSCLNYFLIFNRNLEDNLRGVSIWRTLFVANELNEISTQRTINIQWSLVILGFFLEGLEWSNLSCETPEMNTNTN